MKTDLPQQLEESGTRFVRVLWCDNSSIIRARAIHVGVLPQYLQHGVGISLGQQAIPATADVVAPDSGLGPVGEVRLIPDWATVTPLPYSIGHARVMGDMVRNGKPWPLCPRGFLRRMIERARQAGFEVRAAFENEFYLLRLTPDGAVPFDDTVFASTRAMDLAAPVIDDIVQALLAQNIPVELYYPESGPGQHEISLRYTDALAAADRQVVFRETTHAVAARHGLHASFLPVVFPDSAGSGCHIHLSLWQEDRNVLGDPAGVGGLSGIGRMFLEGILHHLPALMALTTPSVGSYRRLRPHRWSGAYRVWGPDNREAAVRVPTHPAGGGSEHIELKTCDATSNPYLALGAVIAAGLHGISAGLPGTAPVEVDPGSLTEDERAARKIEPLPGSLPEALAALEQDDLLLEALGPELARAFLAVRYAELQAVAGLDLAAEVRLLLERY